MDQNELEFVNLPQRDNPTLSTVSISTVPGVQVEQVADNAESFTGSNEPVHQHYPEHEEFDELSAMADESDPLWTQGHADEQARITLEVDAVNNASAKAFRMPLTSLKRRKSPQEDSQEFHHRVSAKSKVMFSCDVCDLEFCDPKVAVKHISEHHMQSSSFPSLRSSHSSANQEPQLIISNPDGLKTQFIMDGQRLLEMDEGVFIQMNNSTSIKAENISSQINSLPSAITMQNPALQALSEFNSNNIKYETIPITSSATTPLYQNKTQKAKTVPIEPAPKTVWKNARMSKFEHVEISSVPIRGPSSFQQAQKMQNDEYMREEHLDDQNRNRQIMPQNAVVVESYSSNHTSPLSFADDVLDGDIIGLSKCDKAVTMGEKRFTCEKCNKQFYRKNKLLQHMDGHAAEKMHQCQYCGKRFQFKTSLVHHLNCHSANPRFKCHFCGKILSAHKMLLKHLVKQHGQSVDDDLVPVHKCEDCGYKTIYKSDLTKHRRKHTGEKPYKCPICFKEFSDSSILRRHEVVHTGAKPWKCSFCDKAYTLRSTLTNHIKKAHSAWANVNVCTYQNCNKAFATHEEYLKHSKECRGNYSTQHSPSMSPSSAKGTEILLRTGNSSARKQCKFGDMQKQNTSQFQIVNVQHPPNDESKVQIITSLDHSHLDGGITLDEAGRVFTNSQHQLETVVFDQSRAVHAESSSSVIQVENAANQEYRIVGILPENTNSSRKTMRSIVPSSNIVPISTYSPTMYDSDLKHVRIENQLTSAYRHMVVQDRTPEYKNGNILNEPSQFASTPQNPILYQDLDNIIASKQVMVSNSGGIQLIQTVAMANQSGTSNSIQPPRN